jgi:hypothetical protein
MENDNQKMIKYIGAVIIALLLLGLIVSIGLNVKGRKNLNAEKITSETFQAEKINLTAELEKVNNELSLLRTKNSENEKLLAENNQKIDGYEKRINALSSDNRVLRTNNEELADLRKAKEALENENSQLKENIEKLVTRGKELQNNIQMLEEEKKNLAGQIEKAKLYRTDNFLVTATRGKKTEKIVIKASRTKKLNMAFEVPQSLTESISFRLVTPSGETINPGDKSLSWFFPQDHRNLTASLSPVTGLFEQSRQVSLKYEPKTKLSKGEYKIQILCNGSDIGNCRIFLK